MESLHSPVPRLRAQITSLEGVLAELRSQLTHAEAYYSQSASAEVDAKVPSQTLDVSHSPIQLPNGNGKTYESLVDQLDLSQKEQWPRSRVLTPEEYKRYGRQLIMPEIGLGGGLSALK